MIEIAVCDDEKRICEDMKERLLAFAPECRVTCFFSGEALLKEAANFDLVFLDIGLEKKSPGEDKGRMTEGRKNGMEIARELCRYPELLIIFVTAYREYVFDAFDVGAFHYLLKPLDEKKLQHVFLRVLREIKERKEKQPLQIKDGNTWRFVNVADIFYAESSGRKVLLHTVEGILEFYGRMQELEQKLGKDFFRCHRGYLVHLSQVAGYDNTNIYLKNGEHIYLAKQKAGAFADTYLQYLRRVAL